VSALAPERTASARGAAWPGECPLVVVPDESAPSRGVLSGPIPEKSGPDEVERAELRSGETDGAVFNAGLVGELGDFEPDGLRGSDSGSVESPMARPGPSGSGCCSTVCPTVSTT
jgi:hypothetical protein